MNTDLQPIINSLSRVQLDLESRADTLHEQQDYSAEFPANDAANIARAITLLTDRQTEAAREQELRELLLRASVELLNSHNLLICKNGFGKCAMCKLRDDLAQTIGKKWNEPLVPRDRLAFAKLLKDKGWPELLRSFEGITPEQIIAIIDEFEAAKYLMSVRGLGVNLIAVYLRAVGQSFFIEYDARSGAFSIRERGW
jgi:hypothetical protein